MGFLHLSFEVAFSKYFTLFYSVDRDGDAIDFHLFGYCSYSPLGTSLYIPPFNNNSIQLEEEITHFWAHIFTPSFLFSGFTNTFFMETYTPNQFSRQFGLIQRVPLPYLQNRVREPLGSKPPVGVKDSLVVTLAFEAYSTELSSFKMPIFKWGRGYTNLFF